MSDMYDSHETEITLGTSRLLGLFFGLVVVCAVFFGLGFTLGRNTPSPATQGSIVTPAAAQGSAAVKPGASKTPAPEPILVTEGAPIPTEAAPPSKTAHDPAETVGMKVTPAAAAPKEPAAAPPEVMKPANLGQGFVVQIAAVSRKDDAEALVGALRKKNYPVFVVDGPGDKLFHIQVGPFASRPDAQGMKDRLAGDGYNAIVKQ